MRWALAVAALLLGVGCGKSLNCESTDNGNGTTTVACNNDTRELVCTNPDCSGIESDLFIHVWNLTSINLAGLTNVGKMVIYSNAALTSISLPALTTVSGGMSVYDNAALTNLSLPALTTVSGNLSVTGSALTSLSLPALTTVSGNLSVTGSTLTSLSLPALTTVSGNLDVGDNAALTSFRLPALATVSIGLQVFNNKALPSFDFPSLTTISGFPHKDSELFIINNAALTSFRLPALTTVSGKLRILENGALTSFSLPVLSTLGGLPGLPELAFLVFVNNAALPECLALAFRDHLALAHGATLVVEIRGNNTAATCP